MSSKKIKVLSNHEIVTLAVYLLGGASKRIDSEDVAVKANELAPGRFTWRKYPEQINLKNISAFLWDAGKPKNGSQLIGTDVDGWMLTESGLKFAQVRVKKLENVNLARNSISPKERNLLRRERERMLSSDAFVKFSENKSDAISISEAESFFRVDAYVTGDARMEKILRAKNRFGEDPELGALIKLLETKLAKGN